MKLMFELILVNMTIYPGICRISVSGVYSDQQRVMVSLPETTLTGVQ